MNDLTDRQIARRLIGKAIRDLTDGKAHIDDMADNCIMSEQLDYMQDEVSDADSTSPMSELYETAQGCAVEILLDAGYPI